ncbi:hypothetical protein JCM17478_19510 [Thermopirellula anaerolimosa]
MAPRFARLASLACVVGKKGDGVVQLSARDRHDGRAINRIARPRPRHERRAADMDRNGYGRAKSDRGRRSATPMQRFRTTANAARVILLPNQQNPS